MKTHPMIKFNASTDLSQGKNVSFATMVASAAIGKIEMNISIKGRLIKSENSWSLEIGILDYHIQCKKPLGCLKALEVKLKADLENDDLKCFFKVEDSGVFYVITAQTPDMINFLAENLLDIRDLNIDTNLVD